MKWNKYIVRISIALIALVVLYMGQTRIQTVSVPATQTEPQLTAGIVKISAFEHSTGVQIQRPFNTHTGNQSKPEQSFIDEHPKTIYTLCRQGFLQLYNRKIKSCIHFPERIFFCVYRL